MYRIEIVPEALEELDRVPPFYRRMIEKMVGKRLRQEPDRLSKNCKRLDPLVASFAHEPPLWELRVGEWRVFYDLDEESRLVIVRSIRKKPKGKTTEEIV